MKIRDQISISQSNLLRSKLRTFLTISAVLVGTFTISLTNGVGNGIKSYVDRELGNVGAEGTLVVSPRVSFENPLDGGVTEYDPERQAGMFNQTLLGQDDIEQIKAINGVTKVTPELRIQVDYITTGGKKYQATVEQFLEGMNVAMSSGTTLNVDAANSAMIPERYLGPLELGSPEEAVGKTVTMGFKDVEGTVMERQVSVVGVMDQSLLGSGSVYITNPMLVDVYGQQTRGVANLEGSYASLLVNYNPDYSEEQVNALKSLLNANGYNAQTIQDFLGTITTVINGILIVLNVFGGIALLAATFGIVNTLLMSVTERTSEIGLMKALGANRRTIFSIFAIEAASIGFWGSILGVGISMGLAPIVNKLARDNFLKDFTGFELLAFPWAPSVAIVIGIIFLAFLAGALPSIKASKQDPISALRYE